MAPRSRLRAPPRPPSPALPPAPSDFTAGGYDALFGLEDAAPVTGVPQQVGVSFSVLATAAAHATEVQVYVVDSNATRFGISLYVPAQAAWTNVSVAFQSGEWWPAHTLMALPLRSLTLGVGKTPQPGWAGFADIALLSLAPPGALRGPVLHTLVQPRADTSGVLLPSDAPGVFTVTLTNRLEVPCAVAVALQLRNATGVMGEGARGFGAWDACATGPATLAPWQSATLSCAVDPSAAPAGLVFARSLFTACSCWAPGDAPQALEGSVLLALPRPPLAPVLRNAHASVFGGEMVPSYPGVVRVGMTTVRSEPFWAWSQPRDCWEPACFDWGLYE